ncbi:MAG: hypothetical protein KGZ96_07410 [Clostridia bacterium]|nr:hypothetical protein [Clostridia bacterium]
MIKKKYIFYIVFILLVIGIYYTITYSSFISLGFDAYKTSNSDLKDIVEVKPIENPFYEYIEKPQTQFNVLEEIKHQNSNSEEDTNQVEQQEEIVFVKKTTPAKNQDPVNEAVLQKEEILVPDFNVLAAEYYLKFNNLEETLKMNLDTLIEEAILDYNSKKYKKLRLAQIYLNKGSQLEKESDVLFYATLTEFENTLDKYSYDKNILSEIENYYTSNKTAQKKEIMEKGMSLINGK